MVSHPKKLAQLSPSHCSHDAEPPRNCLAALSPNSCASDVSERRNGEGDSGRLVQCGDANQSISCQDERA